MNSNGQFIGYERVEQGLMLVGQMTLNQVYDGNSKVFASQFCSDEQRDTLTEMNKIIADNLRADMIDEKALRIVTLNDFIKELIHYGYLYMVRIQNAIPEKQRVYFESLIDAKAYLGHNKRGGDNDIVKIDSKM